MEKIYKLVDEIYCINLISRPDRYNLMKNFEKEENIKITFYRPEKDPSGGMIGCFKSHIEVIKIAYELGQNKIMVLEDDLIRTKSYNDICYNQITEFINSEDWDIIKITSGTLDPFIILNYNLVLPNLYQGNTLSGASYILNRKSMKKILDTYQNYAITTHYDGYHNKIFKKIYNIIPIIFTQKWDLGSDNIWVQKDIDNIIRKIFIILDNDYNISLFKYNQGKIYLFLILLILIYYIYTYQYK